MGDHSRTTRTLTAAVIVALSLLHQGVGQKHEMRIKDVKVPKHPRRFSNVTLVCEYEGDQEPFSVSWFHNSLEFYKFQPKLKNPKMIFPDSNITVNIEASREGTVVLQEVDLSNSGDYMCLVLAEIPTFQIYNMTKTMTVVVIPDDQPSIEGDLRDHFAVGDIVNLTCTAPPSLPAASLTWYINEDKAPKEYLHEYPAETDDHGLVVSRMCLNFKLSQSHFIKGELKLKCVASIATLYRESNEHSQQEPPVTSKEGWTVPEEESPVITTDNAGCSSVLGGCFLPHTLALCIVLLVSVHLIH